MNHKLIIGLTGGIGSGKSLAGDCFRKLGIDVIDADQASRAVVQPGTEALAKIADHFGTGILLSTGELDRRKLRNIIFDQANERHWLEALLHPLIKQWITDQIAQAKSPYVVLESPLLLETSQHQMVSKTVVVDVPEEIQIQRYLSRDGGTVEQAKAVIAAQMPRDKRLSLADFVLENTGTAEDLHQKVKLLHTALLNIAIP